MSSRPRSGETRSAKSPAEVFLTALTSSFPRQSSETRGLTGTQLSSFVTVCTPHVLSLNFPKLYFNLTKLPPHLSNFQKRVSEVSLFSSVIRKSVLVFLQGWIKKTFQMPRGLPAWSDNLRQQQAGRDPPAPGAGDLSGQSCHHQGPGGHLAPGQGGHQPRAGVQGQGRPPSAQPLLVDRQPPPGPAVHGVSWHYNTSKIVHTKCIE